MHELSSALPPQPTNFHGSDSRLNPLYPYGTPTRAIIPNDISTNFTVSETGANDTPSSSRVMSPLSYNTPPSFVQRSAAARAAALESNTFTTLPSSRMIAAPPSPPTAATTVTPSTVRSTYSPPYPTNSNSATTPASHIQQYNPQRRPVLKILILGDSGVGKTSLSNRFDSNKFTGQYKATIGADFCSKHVTLISSSSNLNNHERECTVQLWDTAGQERFNSLGKSFYRGSDACILVYDVMDMKSFENLNHWKSEFLNQMNSERDLQQRQPAQLHRVGGGKEDEEIFPFIVIGNKMDKDFSHAIDGATKPLDSSSISRRVPESFVERWCHQNDILLHYATSAKTGYNVEAAFMAAAQNALQRQERRDESKKALFFQGSPSLYQRVPLTLNRQGSHERYGNNSCC